MYTRTDIQPYTGLKERASELIIRDPRVLDNGGASPTGGSIAGLNYSLDPLGSVFPVREVIALSNSDLVFAPGYETPLSIIRPVDMVNWMITLRDPAGEFIAQQMPLFRLQPGSRRLYWHKDTLIDPRQCFLTPLIDGMSGLVALRFIFA